MIRHGQAKAIRIGINRPGRDPKSWPLVFRSPEAQIPIAVSGESQPSRLKPHPTGCRPFRAKNHWLGQSPTARTPAGFPLAPLAQIPLIPDAPHRVLALLAKDPAMSG